MSSCFADRLDRYLPLTARERAALEGLEAHPRHVARGQVIRRAEDDARDVFVLAAGWAYTQMLLTEGERQILRIDLPGDLLGIAAIAFAKSPESIVALTDVTVCPFDKQALRQISLDFPRIAALLHILTAADRVALADRIASIGRTSAKSRVAALLIDTLVRLRLSHDEIGEVGDKLPLLMTQEEIGDATGLTAVHVNRMLRALDEEGLISRTAGHVRILDEPRLKRVACYVNRYTALDMSWLPPPER